MTRFKASLIHLSLSAAALIILSLVTLLYWYPDPFYRYANVIDVLQLLALVDVILGPMLTFVVFKPNKPSLKFDLSVIVLAQVAAFIYGGYTIQASHPEFIAFNDGVMYMVPSNSIDDQAIDDEELSRYFNVGPKLAVVRLPSNRKAIQEFIDDGISKGKMLFEFPKYYESYPPPLKEVAQNALEIEKFLAIPSYKAELEQFARDKSVSLSEVYLLKFERFNNASIIVLDKQSAKPVGYLNINPGVLANK
jgi:uncharacterized membrane protein YqjE